MKQSIKERVHALRMTFHPNSIKAFIIPSTDPHLSEYVAPHWMSREWISGFTGSAGTAVILMDEAGNCWAEKMERGTLHYIPRSVAHRLANTGEEVLAVGCCWGADCGHDYASIARTGFAKRLREVDGEPKLG